MRYDDSISLYRRLYAALLRLYPRSHRARYGEGMEQTFSDCLREHARHERGLFVYAAWMCLDTFVGIIKVNMIYMATQRTLLFVIGAWCLLLVPFFAMQFEVGGWDWQPFDYAIMSVLLAGAGIGLAAATNSAFATKKRILGIAIVGLLFVLYVHLAVGIVDTWPLAGS